MKPAHGLIGEVLIDSRVVVKKFLILMLYAKNKLKKLLTGQKLTFPLYLTVILHMDHQQQLQSGHARSITC